MKGALPTPDYREDIRFENVVQRANAIVARHPVLGGHDLGLDYRLNGDEVIIRGAVPSFYLKHVLQCALEGLKGVHHFDNQVAVVSSDGLSSEQ